MFGSHFVYSLFLVLRLLCKILSKFLLIIWFHSLLFVILSSTRRISPLIFVWFRCYSSDAYGSSSYIFVWHMLTEALRSYSDGFAAIRHMLTEALRTYSDGFAVIRQMLLDFFP